MILKEKRKLRSETKGLKRSEEKRYSFSFYKKLKKTKHPSNYYFKRFFTVFYLILIIPDALVPSSQPMLNTY